MIDRLRELLDRPIADGQRRRLFTLVAVAVLGAGIALALTGRPGDTPEPEPPRATRPAPPTTPPPPRRAARPHTTTSTTQATNAARRFLAGYLAYLYGHGPARAIQASSAKLGRRLERERPRVSPATRRRHAHVVELSARHLPNGARLAVTATIDDGGVARYPIALILEPHRAGFEVVGVRAE